MPQNVHKKDDCVDSPNHASACAMEPQYVYCTIMAIVMIGIDSLLTKLSIYEH